MFKRKKTLFSHKDLAPVLSQEDSNKLCNLQNDFANDFYSNIGKMSQEEWLEQTLIKYLPKEDPEQLKQYSKQAIETLDLKEEKLQSLKKARNQGMSSSDWFAAEMDRQTRGMSKEDAAKHINTLAEGLEQANRSAFNRVTMLASLEEQGIKTEGVNSGADNYAARFNHDAELKNSEFRAEVVKPEDPATATSPEVINIVDKQGKVVDSYNVQYADIPDSQEEWDKHNVFAKNLQSAQTTTSGSSIEDFAKEKIEQAKSQIKEAAIEKTSEVISEKLGVDRGTTRKVIDIVTSDDPAAKLGQTLADTAIEKGVEILLGPDGTSSGKYINMPWGRTYDGDVFSPPPEGWTSVACHKSCHIVVQVNG